MHARPDRAPGAVQAVLVAGGMGTRMARTGRGEPKALLPLGGKPVLEHLLLWLKSAGFREAFLCLGYKAEEVRDYFADGSRWGLDLRYHVESSPRGTAGAVRDLAAVLRGDALIVYGDLYVEMDCRLFLDFHASHSGAASLVVIETDHPYDSDLVRAEGDRITGFYRARAGEPCEPWACAAVWAVRPRLLDLVPTDRPSDFARDIFPLALSRGESLRAYRTRESLLDVGTPERLEAAARRWSPGGGR